MIYFLYGADSYRSKKKLEEIIKGYKKVRKSGLNLVYIDAQEKNFDDFSNNFKINSMFAEKKLIILKNVFGNAKFQEKFLQEIKSPETSTDIIVLYENGEPDKRAKLFKALTKPKLAAGIKCQEFSFLQPFALKKWAIGEFDKNKAKIEPSALNLLVDFVGDNLWNLANEINKLSNYKKGAIIGLEDVKLLVRPNAENDIFKTIDALASKNKKTALTLLHGHLENGDHPLYLLSMISYQFRNLLTIKELQEKGDSYGVIVKKSGLHPFVVRKSSYLCGRFTMEKLKKIYRKIFQADSDIKTGKIEPETALDLLLSEI